MKALGTHPHILKLHGYSELEGSRSVLLLEYCANGDLSHWLLAHPKCLSADEVSSGIVESARSFGELESQLESKPLWRPKAAYRQSVKATRAGGKSAN
jgi:hypothetical protein